MDKTLITTALRRGATPSEIIVAMVDGWPKVVGAVIHGKAIGRTKGKFVYRPRYSAHGCFEIGVPSLKQPFLGNASVLVRVWLRDLGNKFPHVMPTPGC